LARELLGCEEGTDTALFLVALAFALASLSAHRFVLASGLGVEVLHDREAGFIVRREHQVVQRTSNVLDFKGECVLVAEDMLKAPSKEIDVLLSGLPSVNCTCRPGPRTFRGLGEEPVSVASLESALELAFCGGRCRFRTCGLCRVKAALSR
jgi:hypothetical protein